MNDPNTSEHRKMSSRGQETVAFLFLALILFPILAVVFVGGFGFVVWMQQLLFGPPGS